MVDNVSQNPEEFLSTPLSKVPCNSELSADVYVKIGDKFIKFKEKGDLIPEEKYNYFISMNVKELFVAKNEIEAFQEAVEEQKKEEIEAIVEEVGEENRPIVELQADIKESVYEAFMDEELSSETVDILKNQVTEFINIIKDKNPSADIFAKISSMNNTIAEHSMNVANLSLLFGMSTGQTHTLVLENLYMGALFHDYGKAKIPTAVMEKPKSVAYAKAITEHPLLGVDMLKKNPQINKQVLSIVAEHHEQFAGVGFPKGMTGDAIYGLSKIVSIANIFDNVCMENRRNKATMYKTAIKVLEYDKGKQFDPELLPRILDAIKLGYGNYHRDRAKKAE
ncbi:MAG: HD domain-containing protein [Bacteriovorax sp.]|nr:HD domain-containing protein [Bacteriovorax sp.]